MYLRAHKTATLTSIQHTVQGSHLAPFLGHFGPKSKLSQIKPPLLCPDLFWHYLATSKKSWRFFHKYMHFDLINNFIFYFSNSVWENSGLFILICFYFTVAKDLAKLARNDKSQLRRRHSITLCESRHRKSSTDSNTSTEVFLFSFNVPNKYSS